MKNLKNKKGLSLIEVVIALAVIAISVLVIMMADRYKWIGFSKSMKVREAINIIEDEIEMIRMEIIDDTTANWPPCASPPCDSTVTKNGINFTFTYDKAYNSEGVEIDNAQNLKVKAKWTSMVGSDSLIIETSLSKNF